MVKTAVKLEWKELDSELEAILVEAELIRAYQPKFNILLKDDKSPVYLVITKEKIPRVLTVRRSDIQMGFGVKTLEVLGPYQSSMELRRVLKVIRKVFLWCQGPTKRGRSCFYYQIGQCSGVCAGVVSDEAYQAQIQALRLFLHGKKKELIRLLEQEMNTASAQRKFEKAALIRDTLRGIERVTRRHDEVADEKLPELLASEPRERLVRLRRLLRKLLSLPPTYPLRRIEGYDVSTFQGALSVGAMVVFQYGQANTAQYRQFHLKDEGTPNDVGMMKEMLIRRQKHLEWGLPDLIVIDGGKSQVKAALSVWKWSCPVVGLAKAPDRLVVFPPRSTKAVELPLQSGELASGLLQQIRDEAHRFSNTHQHARRLKFD